MSGVVPVLRGRRPQAGLGAVGWGEDPLAWPASVVSSANVLLLDEPTNNSIPPRARRCWRRSGPTRAQSSSSPTTKARSLCSSPTVLLLPDGDEDLWNDDDADLVSS